MLKRLLAVRHAGNPRRLRNVKRCAKATKRQMNILRWLSGKPSIILFQGAGACSKTSNGIFNHRTQTGILLDVDSCNGSIYRTLNVFTTWKVDGATPVLFVYPGTPKTKSPPFWELFFHLLDHHRKYTSGHPP